MPLTVSLVQPIEVAALPWWYRCAGILHTIIFNRALGPVRPREVDSELFDITYVCILADQKGFSAGHQPPPYSHSSAVSVLQVQCGELFVEKSIEEKIDQFYSWVEKHPGKRGQVKSPTWTRRPP